jgi:DNA polymerase-1
MERIFICDGNWYLHRVFFTYKSSRPMEEGLPYNFLALLMKDACAVKATHILVAFDGHEIFRYKVFPEYKANRSEKKMSGGSDDEPGKDVYACLPNLRQLLVKCGVALTQQKKYEADDVWASAAVQYAEQGYEVVGGGKDKDGFQVLRKGVRMYDSSAKPEPKFMTAEKAEKLKGVPIRKMVMYQTLLGDQIDNIPQILSPAKAKAVCLEHKSIKAWFESADKKTREFLRAKQAQLVVNRKLVELKTDLALPEPQTLKPAKVTLEGMPASWYAHQELCWPKSRGLFGRR